MMQWFKRQRLKFIENKLMSLGYINRRDMMKEFGISKRQASVDFTEFQRTRVGMMKYNKSAMRWEKVVEKPATETAKEY